MQTWIIVTERFAEGPKYLTDMAFNRSYERQKAMKFTDKQMAWKTAVDFESWFDNTSVCSGVRHIRARVVPQDGSYGA